MKFHEIHLFYYQEKKWMKAEEYFILAYEDVIKRIRHDGNEKRNVMAVSLMNRAMIFKDLKEYEKSYRLMIQALEIRKKPFSNLSDKSWKLFALRGTRRGRSRARARARSFSPGNFAKSGFSDLGWS